SSGCESTSVCHTPGARPEPAAGFTRKTSCSSFTSRLHHAFRRPRGEGAGEGFLLRLPPRAFPAELTLDELAELRHHGARRRRVPHREACAAHQQVFEA